MINFLTYNEIIEEKELAAETNWESPETGVKTPTPKPNSDNIYKEYTEEIK